MEELKIFPTNIFFLKNFPLDPEKAVFSAVLKRFLQKVERMLPIVRYWSKIVFEKTFSSWKCSLSHEELFFGDRAEKVYTEAGDYSVGVQKWRRSKSFSKQSLFP